MSDAAHTQTLDKDRVPNFSKIIYGCGAFVNKLLAASIRRLMIVLNLGLGMLPRLTNALTDPLMGFISDNTRSRWGRRRPYIRYFYVSNFQFVSFPVKWTTHNQRHWR